MRTKNAEFSSVTFSESIFPFVVAASILLIIWTFAKEPLSEVWNVLHGAPPLEKVEDLVYDCSRVGVRFNAVELAEMRALELGRRHAECAKKEQLNQLPTNFQRVDDVSKIVLRY